jgi:hypothetical protein
MSLYRKKIEKEQIYGIEEQTLKKLRSKVQRKARKSQIQRHRRRQKTRLYSMKMEQVKHQSGRFPMEVGKLGVSFS